MIEDADCREGKKEVISWIDHRTQDRLDRMVPMRPKARGLA